MGCSGLRNAHLRFVSAHAPLHPCIHIYPTSARTGAGTAIARVEGLSRLGRRWSCADLDVAAAGAADKRLSLRQATRRADRVQRRATQHY